MTVQRAVRPPAQEDGIEALSPRRQQRLLEHLLAAEQIAALGSWSFDFAAAAFVWSPEMSRIFGWPSDMPPTGGAILQAVHADDRERVEAWIARQRDGAVDLVECRFRIRRGDGVIRHLYGRSRPLKAADGRTLGLRGTVQDVTDQRDADGALGEDAFLYRSMFENAIWGIFQTTSDGKYLTANSALARIYGYDSPATMLAAFTDIGRQLYVEPSRRDAFVRQMRENGRVTGFESQVYRRDGAVIWISESCREVRTSSGELLYYEGTVEEISARKQAELELCLAKEQAETASRAKSAFLANMSHELRTPLNAILGFAEMMKDEVLGPIGNARYGEFARDIHGSGKHLLDVINDILDLAKIEAGHLALAQRDVDVGNIMAACERLVADRARAGAIRFAVEQPAPAVLVRADPTRMRQILLNLLSNAVKFTPHGQSVTMQAEPAPDGGYEFRIVDTGIGMTAAEVEKALLPFQQIDNSLARRYEGTGLGLTLTKSLVELHRGTLTIDSAPGRGTTVSVWLPKWRFAGAGSIAN